MLLFQYLIELDVVVAAAFFFLKWLFPFDEFHDGMGVDELETGEIGVGCVFSYRDA